MNHDDAYYDEIHRFLLDELTAEEAAAFQSRLDADATLADAVRLEEELQLLITYQRRGALKQMLRDSHADREEDESDADEDEGQSKPDAPTDSPQRSALPAFLRPHR